jgi:hypothetical protein
MLVCVSCIGVRKWKNYVKTSRNHIFIVHAVTRKTAKVLLENSRMANCMLCDKASFIRRVMGRLLVDLMLWQ